MLFFCSRIFTYFLILNCLFRIWIYSLNKTLFLLTYLNIYVIIILKSLSVNSYMGAIFGLLLTFFSWFWVFISFFCFFMSLVTFLLYSGHLWCNVIKNMKYVWDYVPLNWSSDNFKHSVHNDLDTVPVEQWAGKPDWVDSNQSRGRTGFRVWRTCKI